MALLYGIYSEVSKCVDLKMKEVDQSEAYSEVYNFSKEIAKVLQLPAYCISFEGKGR